MTITDAGIFAQLNGRRRSADLCARCEIAALHLAVLCAPSRSATPCGGVSAGTVTFDEVQRHGPGHPPRRRRSASAAVDVPRPEPRRARLAPYNAVSAPGFGVVAGGRAVPGGLKVQPAQVAAFRQRYLDALAVAKAALALPWVDTSRVYTFGEGFGGGLALLATSLCPAVSRCAALNPLPRFLPALVCPDTTSDAANFAPLCRAEVLLGTCLMDEYAPPKGQAAIYNRLSCPARETLPQIRMSVNF